MRSEWDETKRAANIAKHGIDFTVAYAFDWSCAEIAADTRLAYGETRWVARGPIERRVHVLVFVLRGQSVRLISLRKANKKEMRDYGKGI